MRFYSILLYLYPRSFRAEYGDELRKIFEQNRPQVSGAFPLLAFWLSEIFDTCSNAARVHWDIFLRDLKFSQRTILRAPGFAVTAILVTALGIGANTAVFSLVNHVLIRPFPFKDAERIVRLWESEAEYVHTELSPPNYRDWQQRSTSFESMAAYSNVSKNLVGNGIPERVDGASVTASLFPLLGIKPVIGRLFTMENDRNGSAGTVLLSYGLWQTRFGRSTGALGKRIRLDDETYSVIGVLPSNVNFPTRETQFWIPFRFTPANFEDRGDRYLYGIAKLKQGVTLEMARAEMAVITQKLEQEYPQENARARATVEKLREGVSRQSRVLLAALLGASGCVLLIACTNLANLFLIRAMGRRKELSVRAALGAGRERLVRQLLTESLVLSFFGAIVGVSMAYTALPLLTKLIPVTLPIGEATILDIRVLGFSTILFVATAVVCGVFPSYRIFGHADISGLREGSRSGIGGRRENVRSALVIAEVTASVLLLIASGLLIRALWRIQSTDPGFSTRNVLTLQTPLPLPKYEITARRVDFYTRVLSQVRGLPDVSNAAYISSLPMVQRGGIWGIEKIDGIVPEPGESPKASLRYVTPGFFGALGIQIQRGRDVSESDTIESQPVAVVSESFVRHHFPNENPLGHQLYFAFQDRTIVGVVNDIRVRGLEWNSEPQVYLPCKQVPDRSIIGYVPRALVIRSTSNPGTLLAAVRQIIQRVDPEMPIADVRTLQDVVDSDTAPRQTQIRVMALFAVLALMLAGIGIHGLLGFAVSEHTTEIGVRLALGAQLSDVLRMVLRHGFQVAAIGGSLGLILAYIAARAMQSILAGVKPSDAATFLVACALALLTTISGSLVPALRAIRIDPVIAMRVE